MSLIGPNGAGKTTFFNMITGAYVPTDGRDRFDGQPIVDTRATRCKSRKPHEVTAMGIGRTFQNIRLFGTMSALDNVRTGIHVHLKSRWWDSILRTPQMLNEEAETDRPRRCGSSSSSGSGATGRDVGAQPARTGTSAGSRSRARWAPDPKLLLLDEPTAGMNASETREMTDFIRRLRAELGLTVLLIEHDMRVVMGISDRITVLDLRRGHRRGQPGRGPRQPRVIEAYLGRGAAEA